MIKTIEIENGARRSCKAPAYHLLIPAFIRAVANRMGEGIATHGEANYQRGGALFVTESENHLEEHWQLYKAHDTEDDHLIAIACNCMILWWHRNFKNPQS